jgi:hypothetical protein
MQLPAVIETPIRVALLLSGLLLPGSMLLRALRLPWSLAAAFMASSAMLYLVVLTFTSTGVPISVTTLAGALFILTVAGRLLPARADHLTAPSPLAFLGTLGRWLPLYLVFWAIVGYRLWFQPLSGPDVSFRWTYLAEQMLRFRSLDFYPPRTSADFVRYFWAESIPPGIASVYAWAYGCGGSRAALWTSPVVALQLLAVHEFVWRIASHWGGDLVARRAVLLAAASPLLTWSCLIGQETGLLAAAVCGLVWCLPRLSEPGGSRWAVLAAVLAIAAGSAREYGPVFALAAVAGAMIVRAPPGRVLLVGALALPLAAAWPLRVWWLTGNPFYSLEVGGFFPTNPAFTAWNHAFRGPHEFAGASAESWQQLGRYLLLWSLPAALGAVALVGLVLQRLREATTVLFFVVLVAVLWFTSVSFTAGGLFYSLRVLSPALALLCVTAGYAITTLFRNPWATRSAAVFLALACAEALPKTLVLPENPYRIGIRSWFAAGGAFMNDVKSTETELVAKLSLLPGPRPLRIVSDYAGLPRCAAVIGADVVPLWSPEVAWLFDRQLKPEEAAVRWRMSNLRYVLIGKSGASADFVRARARWTPPDFTVVPITESDSQVVLEVVANPPAAH